MGQLKRSEGLWPGGGAVELQIVLLARLCKSDCGSAGIEKKHGRGSQGDW